MENEEKIDEIIKTEVVETECNEEKSNFELKEDEEKIDEIIKTEVVETECNEEKSNFELKEDEVIVEESEKKEVPSNVKHYLENFANSYSKTDFSDTASVETNNLLFAIFSELKAIKDALNKK